MGGRRLLVFKFADWISIALIGILAAFAKSSPTAPSPPIGLGQSLHAILINNYVAWIIVLTILSLASKGAQEFLNAAHKVRIRTVLDALRDSYFADVLETERHFNRVTVFKANRQESELNAFCRSGTQFQRCRTKFRIDHENENANQGIAGWAWFVGATVTQNELPEPIDPWDDSHDSCKQYAEAGRTPVAQARQLKVKSRSILATPIRNLRGDKWGVLVLDSRQPGSMIEAQEPLVKLMATAIGRMV